MSETKKPEVQDKPAVNIEALQAKLKRVYDAAMKNAGKTNHNPHIWLRDNYQKLVDLVKNGPLTKELSDSVLALSETPDTRINKTIPDPIEPKK